MVGASWAYKQSPIDGTDIRGASLGTTLMPNFCTSSASEQKAFGLSNMTPCGQRCTQNTGAFCGWPCEQVGLMPFLEDDTPRRHRAKSTQSNGLPHDSPSVRDQDARTHIVLLRDQEGYVVFHSQLVVQHDGSPLSRTCVLPANEEAYALVQDLNHNEYKIQ